MHTPAPTLSTTIENAVVEFTFRYVRRGGNSFGASRLGTSAKKGYYHTSTLEKKREKDDIASMARVHTILYYWYRSF